MARAPTPSMLVGGMLGVSLLLAGGQYGIDRLRCRSIQNKIKDANLSGKVVLVTGGTSGIGYATSLEMARRGATVVVLAKDAARMESSIAQLRAESGSSQIHPLICDLANLQQVRDAVKTFESQFSRLDVLVNNAATSRWAKETTTEAGLDLHFSVNFMSHVLLTRLLTPLLIKSTQTNQNGEIVPPRVLFSDCEDQNIHQAHLLPIDNKPVFGKGASHSKVALRAFALELSERTAAHGLISSLVSSSLVRTAQHGTAPPVYRWLVNWFGRDPQDVANVFVWMSTNSAARNLTAKILDVGGSPSDVKVRDVTDKVPDNVTDNVTNNVTDII
eukprot:TRINITY_DN10351_c0_g3_i1.p1 TRINITY_DN10351_c0_g3~~TRINITY_DN10351_c0_g3_i1.p1  ORF type:complete len:331 (+),score=50.79 TRINITY_DN10351_c0_g3_i1:79-1071(+)